MSIIKYTVTCLAATACVALLSSCAMFNKTAMHYNRTTTIGQELSDLHTAKEKGAVTKEVLIPLFVSAKAPTAE